MCISGFLQRTADKADIIGCTASAACLADDDSEMVCVILTGQDGVHDLSDHDKGRIAGVVVHIF